MSFKSSYSDLNTYSSLILHCSKSSLFMSISYESHRLNIPVKEKKKKMSVLVVVFVFNLIANDATKVNNKNDPYHSMQVNFRIDNVI